MSSSAHFHVCICAKRTFAPGPGIVLVPPGLQIGTPQAQVCRRGKDIVSHLLTTFQPFIVLGIIIEKTLLLS